MKLSTTTSPTPAYPITIVNSFNNYHIVPDTYTKVATRTSATDIGQNATGSELTTTYAAYISKTQSADTYTGKVKYTLVHPANEIPAQPKDCASGYICYFPNTNIVEGTMGRQAVTSSNTTAKLFAANFSKTGYGFAGWSDAYDYKTNNNAHFYGPNETISFTAGDYTGSNPGLSLYAVWVKSEGFFQDSSKTTSVCNGLAQASVNGTRTLNSVSALTDNRDNQTYAIAKLADGKCWMIENLRLDNTAELTTLNTNNPLNDGTKVTIKHNYIDTQTYSTLSATSSVAYDATSAPNGWCSTSSTPCDDQSRLRTDNTANRTSYTATSSMSTSDNLYSYGNYYNWYSATAGRGTYDFDTDNVSTTGDLCPNGWKLPRGGDKTKIESNHDNDFWNLVVDVLNGGVNPANYTSTTMPYYDGTAESSPVDLTIRTYPNNFLHSGTTDGASISFRGTLGYYWSSTAYSPNTAYAIYYLNSSVRPGTANSYKYGGWSIRCLFQPN